MESTDLLVSSFTVEKNSFTQHEFIFFFLCSNGVQFERKSQETLLLRTILPLSAVTKCLHYIILPEISKSRHLTVFSVWQTIPCITLIATYFLTQGLNSSPNFIFRTLVSLTTSWVFRCSCWCRVWITCQWSQTVLKHLLNC